MFQFKFNKTYFLLALLLLFIEIGIGTFVRDAIIRPYGGDFLVVILIYCMVKSAIDAPVIITASSVLIFAYLVEISQYFHVIQQLGLQNSKFASIILGTQFSFTDMLVYTLGIVLVYITEMALINLKRNRGFALK